MLRMISTLVLGFGLAVTTRADSLPVVYETKAEWLIDQPADKTGAGASFTIVDKQSGVARSYQPTELSGEPVTKPSWVDGGQFEVPVECIVPVVGESEISYAGPQPLENRVHLYTVTGGFIESLPPTKGVGPNRLLSFPPHPDLKQDEPVVVVQTSLNGPPSETQFHRFISPEGERFASQDDIGFIRFDQAISLSIIPSRAYSADNSLLLLSSGTEVFLAVPELTQVGAMEPVDVKFEPRFVLGDFSKSGVSDVAMYEVKGTTIFLSELVEDGDRWLLGKPFAYKCPLPILLASRIEVDGQDYVAVAYWGSPTVEVIDVLNERVVDRFDLNKIEGVLSGVVSFDGTRLLALGSATASGPSDSYELFEFDTATGGFKSTWAGSISTKGLENAGQDGRANAFYFDVSPLESRNAELLGWQSSDSDWASDEQLQGSAPNQSVRYQGWKDSGEEDGLQLSQIVSSRIRDEVNSVIVNQVDDFASVIGVGMQGSLTRILYANWTPKPGMYDTLVPISASYPSGSTLYYRINSDGVWNRYTGTFYPPAHQFDVQYFVEGADRTKGPIRSARYEFALSAFNRDQNEDGIPDFVQLGLGLDIEGTGDSDADGVRDIDELYLGTDPLDLNDFPDLDADLLSPLNRELDENLIVSAVNYAGADWAPASDVYLDALTGAHLGQEVAELDAANDVVANFGPVRTVQSEGLLALFSGDRFFCSGDSSSAPTGFECLMLLPSDPGLGLSLSTNYTGGSLSAAANLWVAELLSSATAGIPVRREQLSVRSTAIALAYEYALELYLQDVGYLSESDQLTLFPNRSGDDRWLSLTTIAEAQQLDVDGLLAGLELLDSLDVMALEVSTWALWPSFCGDVYEAYVLQQLPSIAGRRPVDLLRQVLRQQTPDPELLRDLGLTLDQSAELAIAEAIPLRDHLVEESVQHYDLIVTETADVAGCLLTEDTLSRDFSLFQAEGQPYVASKAFDLLVGTRIRVNAVERSDWIACSGRALEVRSLTLVELPELLIDDADGNLLDDNWQLLWMLDDGVDPFASVDGSGYTLLQQYLHGTNPNDPADVPTTPVADLGAPSIQITEMTPTQITLTWDWPGEYSDQIRFKLIASDSLGNLQSIEPLTVDYSRIGDVHTMEVSVPATDEQRFFRLVMSL